MFLRRENVVVFTTTKYLWIDLGRNFYNIINKN